MINRIKRELKAQEIRFPHLLLINLLILFICFVLPANKGLAQNLNTVQKNQKTADSIFKNTGEAYFKFEISQKAELNRLTKLISIENVKGNTVYAFANRKEFVQFLNEGYKYTLLTQPGYLLDKSLLEYKTKKNKGAWDYYPSYADYELMMNQFAANYPKLCKLDTIGILPSGHKLLAAVITSDKSPKEGKPKFLYTSSMHGNELTGYVLMLRLIDTLLTSYNNSANLTRLLDNLVIYINPLANPDGTFRYSDNSVYGSTRENANDVDINRNFPDPSDGEHPDGNAWQPETVAFMDYATKNNFTMSANLHTGSEVVNYPWDTWERLTADNDWWVCVSRQFADTVHKYSFSGYFIDEDNGITDGYMWYRVTGGRQDYMNYFKHGRECTIELSNNYIPNPVYLPLYWNYFKRSFINYIDKSTYGIRGLVTDSTNGKGLDAKIHVNNHDIDSSEIYSTLPLGDYHRLIYGGTYDITFSKKGYYDKTIKSVNLSSTCDSAKVLNVILDPIGDKINNISNEENIEAYVTPNPSDGHFKIILLNDKKAINDIKLYDIMGNEINTALTLEQTSTGKDQIQFDLKGLARGLYFTRIYFKNNSSVSLKTVIN